MRAGAEGELEGLGRAVAAVSTGGASDHARLDPVAGQVHRRGLDAFDESVELRAGGIVVDAGAVHLIADIAGVDLDAVARRHAAVGWA